MAEAILNATEGDRFSAFSAGSQPTGKVNPHAINQLMSIGCMTENLRSKSWHEFAKPGASHMDFVITVCDSAAGEICPVWPGQPIAAHWSFKDPAKTQGSDEAVEQAFRVTCREIKTRLDIFQSLPIEKLERLALKCELEKIGEFKP
jgi:arsenate reductase